MKEVSVRRGTAVVIYIQRTKSAGEKYLLRPFMRPNFIISFL